MAILVCLIQRSFKTILIDLVFMIFFASIIDRFLKMIFVFETKEGVQMALRSISFVAQAQF
jgi:hypothetical protein